MPSNYSALHRACSGTAIVNAAADAKAVDDASVWTNSTYACYLWLGQHIAGHGRNLCLQCVELRGHALCQLHPLDGGILFHHLLALLCHSRRASKCHGLSRKEPKKWHKKRPPRRTVSRCYSALAGISTPSVLNTSTTVAIDFISNWSAIPICRFTSSNSDGL